jgi:hypothetical protein
MNKSEEMYAQCNNSGLVLRSYLILHNMQRDALDVMQNAVDNMKRSLLSADFNPYCNVLIFFKSLVSNFIKIQTRCS